MQEPTRTVFALLDPRLQRELAALGFSQPTPIQTLAIPRILRGETVLLIAPTGHGKTEAAFLPLLHQLIVEPMERNGIQVLWITPLRALNRDILRRLVLLAQHLGVKVEVRHGDTSQSTRRRQTRQPPSILVTTPETLQALLAAPLMREHLRSVRWVVIDEIHELESSKRGVQLAVALERLRELTQKTYQRIGLSATVGNPQAVAAFMAGGAPCGVIQATSPKKLLLRVEYVPFERRNSSCENSSRGIAVERIRELIGQHRSTLIFCNTRQTAEALGLRLMGVEPEGTGVHHGSLSREARVEAERKFKEGETSHLVCTSSLELGLDIGTADLVIQYGSPRQVLRLIQRVGRAGHRLGVESKGIIIATSFDDLCESCVIVRRALAGLLETPPIHTMALDVMAHQLVGLAIEYKGISWRQALKIIRRATPYRELDEATFHQVLRYLERERLIALEGEKLRPRRKSYPYYFENLSVIPDVPYHEVIDIATRREVGWLDADFADEHGQRGNIVVLRGRPWEVVERDGERMFVAPVRRIEGRIPRWTGELIPVSREVATETGKLWRRIAERLDEEGAAPPDVTTNKLAEGFMREIVSEQLQHGFLPDDNNIYIEVLSDLVVVHCCFGTRVNETLARILAALVTTKLGIELVYYADQYRIVFRFERGNASLVGDAVEEGLRSVDTEHIEGLLELALRRSPSFGRRFIHVARRFGAVSREADIDGERILRMIRYFEGTPVLDEALREFFVDKLDLAGTREVLEAIQAGRIRLTAIHATKPSPFARETLRRFGEFLEPPTPEAFLLDRARERLENSQVKLVCLHCAQWSSVRTIRLLDDRPRCPKCGSRLLAGLFPTDDLLERALRRYRAGYKLTPDEKRTIRKGRENANLVLTYGKAALIVMAGRGIGPTVAKRILATTQGKITPSLYREILEMEKQFIRTRRWWTE